jgi:hypothetical protein
MNEAPCDLCGQGAPARRLQPPSFDKRTRNIEHAGGWGNPPDTRTATDVWRPSITLDKRTHTNTNQVWGQGQAQSAIGFEWDYQSTSYDDMPHYSNNVTAASQYMAGMADAAERIGLPIQYCMSYPRHILESMKHRAVTNARASPDYADSGDNLVQVAYTSLLYQAVGIAPSKDTFFTTGDHYERAHAIVAALSTGPVGPSDKIEWLENHSDYILAACTLDGRLLQPTVAIATIDAKYSLDPSTAVPAGSHVWVASSVIDGSTPYTSHTVLSLFLPSRAGFLLWPNDTYPQMDSNLPHVYRDWDQPLCSDGDSIIQAPSLAAAAAAAAAASPPAA